MAQPVAERIPGVLVRDVEPPIEYRPRLDVAGLVGFAQRGPVDVPVRIEDYPTFEQRFGCAVDLEAGAAADETSGNVWVHPLLPYAVRAFFENGGRRCWVVRVSGPAARRAEWVLPGVVLEDGTAVRVRADSPGGWANGFRLRTRLQPATLPRREPVWRAERGWFELGAPDSWEAGDVLRLTQEDGVRRLFHVSGIEHDPATRGRWLARGRFLSTDPIVTYDGSLRRLERLRFDLEVIGPQLEDVTLTDRERLEDLAFGPEHERYWMRVLAEQSLFLAPPAPGEAGAADAPPVTVPHQMTEAGAVAALFEPDSPGLDDFGGFDSELLAPTEIFQLNAGQLRDLAAQAHEDAYRASLGGYVRDPLRLRALLALLPIDEVGLLAVPDALQLEGLLPLSLDLRVRPPASAVPLPPEPLPIGFRGCDAEPPAPEPAPPATTESLSAPPRRVLYGFSETQALRVQRAAIRLCALRADMVAVLATPAGLDPVDWRRRLDDAAFDYSYAALYAPWTLVRAPRPEDPNALRAVPPDGAACGAIARRELRRGVWVAPANEPLAGVVGLSERATAERWADLLAASLNLVRPVPGDFRLMSARTLALDPEWVQLNVRRLLIYLRKLLLVWGQEYVFESNTPALRSALGRRIERELERLFRAGAFAGATAAESYQVVVDDTVNPPASVDGGHLITLVKVAPSWPLEFLEVRLMRTGTGPLQVQEG